MKDEIKQAIDTLQRATANCTAGDRHIVVLDRGWIFVGDLSQDEHDIFTITNCKNVRKWNKGGFGLLSQSATKAEAVLDDCVPIRFEKSARILVVPVAGDWDE